MTTDGLTGIGVAVGILVLLGRLVFVTTLLVAFIGLVWLLWQRRQPLETRGDAPETRRRTPLVVRAWAAVVATVVAAVRMPAIAQRMGPDEAEPRRRRPR